jgi:hypothetical protein
MSHILKFAKEEIHAIADSDCVPILPARPVRPVRVYRVGEPLLQQWSQSVRWGRGTSRK